MIENGLDLIAKDIYNPNRDLKIFGSTIRRTLLHFIDSTQKGKLCPPHLQNSTIFDKDAIIPLNLLPECLSSESSFSLYGISCISSSHYE